MQLMSATKTMSLLLLQPLHQQVEKQRKLMTATPLFLQTLGQTEHVKLHAPLLSLSLTALPRKNPPLSAHLS